MFISLSVADASAAGGTNGRLAIVDSEDIHDWLKHEFSSGYEYV